MFIYRLKGCDEIFIDALQSPYFKTDVEIIAFKWPYDTYVFYRVESSGVSVPSVL